MKNLVSATETQANSKGSNVTQFYLDATDDELIALARQDDLIAQEYIVLRYKNLVRAKARPYFLVGADRDDIIQEGMIGLYKAMRDYDQDKNASFRAFADLCVTRQIITAIKAATRFKHVPLNSYVSFSMPTAADDNVRTFEEVVSHTEVTDPEELFIVKENFARVRGILNDMLSEFENQVLANYLDGATYQEISDKLGTHVKSVDNALQRVKKKLAAALKS